MVLVTKLIIGTKFKYIKGWTIITCRTDESSGDSPCLSGMKFKKVSIMGSTAPKALIFFI